MSKMDNINTFAVERIARAVGPVAGPEAAREVLKELGLPALRSASELLQFSERLIRRGGVFEAVGRGLKVSALLRGARAV